MPKDQINAQMVHTVNKIRFKFVFLSSRSLSWISITWNSKSKRAHVANFYGRQQLIRSA